MRRFYLPLPLVLAATLTQTGCPAPDRATELDRACAAPGLRRTARFVRANQKRYEQAKDRAVAYLDTFSIDPIKLRQEGIKGRKKLVELLDAYLSLHRHSRGARRGEMKERFRHTAQVTYLDTYHDMGRVGDKQFKQDATSYLRACYLMEKMGLDTARYRAEIGRIKGRLDGHMHLRGPHQRMAFNFYYRHFGLAPCPELTEPFKQSVTSRRVNPYLLSLNDVYDLTHEVFVPYDYGGKLDARYFSDRDRSYLRRALDILGTVYLHQRNVDILGEILASLRYLGYSDLPVYREGLSFLLSGQQKSGAFGSYENLRAQRGDRLELDLYLHTTSVAMDVLPLAFEGPLLGE